MMETLPASNDPLAERIDYLDNLRALAMLLGVYLHGALAYAEPARHVWLATNPSGSHAVDVSIWFIHLFRMSLFFLLAGYFAQRVWVRRGLRKLLAGRFLRLVIPFVLFYPGLLIAVTVVIGFALAYIHQPEGLLALIAAEARKPVAERQPPQIGTMHLWFLYYLLWFVIAGVAMHWVADRFRLLRLSLEPIHRAWRGGNNQGPSLEVERGIGTSRGLGLAAFLFAGPLLLVPAAWVAGSPLPAPESFALEWWPFAFYGLFYALGGWLFRREYWLDVCQPHLGWLAIVGGLSFCGYYASLPDLQAQLTTEGKVIVSGGSRGLSAVLTAYLTVWLTLLALLVGRRLLTARNGVLRFIADSSYWVYLVHLPLVLFWQIFLTPLPWPLWIKLAVVLAGTMIPCLLTYLVFVRYTPMGWLLHGKRRFP